MFSKKYFTKDGHEVTVQRIMRTEEELEEWMSPGMIDFPTYFYPSSGEKLRGCHIVSYDMISRVFDRYQVLLLWREDEDALLKMKKRMRSLVEEDAAWKIAMDVLEEQESENLKLQRMIGELELKTFGEKWAW